METLVDNNVLNGKICVQQLWITMFSMENLWIKRLSMENLVDNIFSIEYLMDNNDVNRKSCG